MSAGQVTITAGISYIPDALAYAVAPDAAPEQMIHLDVILENASNTSQRIADATIEITPERGTGQRCQSNRNGVCPFWIFPTPVHVRATRTGFLPAEAVSTPVDNPTNYSSSFILRMTPAQ